jgi:hypothetical protein
MSSLLALIPNFNFRNAAARKGKWNAPIQTVLWDDDIPRTCISEDGVHGVAYLPNLTPRLSLVSWSSMLLF